MKCDFWRLKVHLKFGSIIMIVLVLYQIIIIAWCAGQLFWFLVLKTIKKFSLSSLFISRKFSWCLDSRAWRIVITFVVIFANVTVKCRGYGRLKERQEWLFREVAVIFLSTSLLFFIKIMCTTSKRDVGLAGSLKYLSLKGYKILMEVWCSDGEGFFFFFFLFFKEHIQPLKPYVSMQLEYSCSSILLNFLSLQSWIGFQLELTL